MRRTRGFKLGRKVVRVFRWFIGRRGPAKMGWARLGGGGGHNKSCSIGALSKLFTFKGLSFPKLRSGYIRVGQEPLIPSKIGKADVPKGHLAVYVGSDDDDASRVIVPVIYFNHPLFAELLRDTEKVYGFDHPGGIQIPCQKSEFEDVKMKIAAASGCNGRRRSWRQLLMNSRRREILDH
ncbi:OLC1v1029360C1 [Oldenlandia corymbosa var. corymbosa]|uniref:OLC1v1029360C1 n=1 Tax=Oldenlandia corymbosa var. corymbosa TaxID=529605 RepID=A0AAV1CDS4_OLDCO|nr:OLC1v1029360C1 [Oldenlandia corymbosa var. corymbosa]